MATLHALLVGIDAYQGDVSPLRGCRNDALRAREILGRHAEAAGLQTRTTMLLDERATRDAFVATFRTAFAEAGAGDTALLWYSGHGSQETAPPEHLPFEPDGLNETLVLADSRTEGGQDLADKELAALVAEVAERGVHVVVVLDCCHSGSGVREVDDGVTVRRAPTARARRDASSYLSGTAEQLGAGDGARLGTAPYVLIAGCRSDQTAKEVRQDDGTSRGAMSLALEAALTSAGGPLTYLQLQRAIATSVRAVVSDQNPVLECRPSTAADSLFLGGAAQSGGPLLVAAHGPAGWRLDAGALHGIPARTVGSRPTRVTLHPLTAPDLDEATAVARAHTGTVRSGTSELVVDAGSEALDPAATYRAVVRDLPTDRTTVRVDDDVPGRSRIVAALDAAPGLGVTDDAAAKVVVRHDRGRLLVVRPGATRPLVAAHVLAGDPSDEQVTALRDEVVHVGRWLALRDRHNPTPRITDADLRLELLDTADRPLPVDPDGGVRVLWRDDLADWPRMRVRITNASPRRLFVTALALSELYGAEPFFHGEGEWLDPGAAVYVPAVDGTPDLYLSVPEGEQLTTDLFMVIAATQEFTSRSLALPELAPPPALEPTRGAGPAGRGISAAPPRLPEDLDDWTTRQVAVTTYRPGAAVSLGDGRTVELAGGAVVLEHPTLRGRARLVPGSQSVREAMVPLVPPALADDPASVPFSFVPARSADAQVDVLELDGVDNPEVVSEQDPLLLRLPQPLGEDEVLLPVMFDGEDYLPLGVGLPSAGGTEVRLTRLPTQGEMTTRSLGGSLKILFRKLVARRLGAGYDYPHLSLVRYDADGTPSYEHDPERVREALAGARTALLLVHGIIGDTRGMTRAAGPESGLADGVDAVLALDYENLHTAIEATAADLAEALAEVGVTAGSGPRLTVVAHSMGGLVSRCFVERQGGAQVVDRLVTCGTPHRGSPWPRVQDAVTTMLGLAVNGLAAGGPLAAVGTTVAFLARGLERVDTALDQMRPGSVLLRTLETAPDPGIPYAAVRGDQPLPPWADTVAAARVVAKLAGRSLDAVFGGESHDIAVTVASAGGVGAGWARPPVVLDAACNHLTYFSSPEGMAAVREALATVRPSDDADAPDGSASSVGGRSAGPAPDA